MQPSAASYRTRHVYTYFFSLKENIKILWQCRSFLRVKLDERLAGIIIYVRVHCVRSAAQHPRSLLNLPFLADSCHAKLLILFFRLIKTSVCCAFSCDLSFGDARAKKRAHVDRYHRAPVVRRAQSNVDSVDSITHATARRKRARHARVLSDRPKRTRRFYAKGETIVFLFSIQ